MGRTLALALLLAACGSTSTGASTSTSATPVGLPATCSGACVVGDQCRNGFDWQCTCVEHEEPNCGGAPRPRLTTWQWECVQANPPPPAPDACPAAAPADGSPCTVARACAYPGVCSWYGANARCDGSVWHVEQWMTSPPP